MFAVIRKTNRSNANLSSTVHSPFGQYNTVESWNYVSQAKTDKPTTTVWLVVQVVGIAAIVLWGTEIDIISV